MQVPALLEDTKKMISKMQRLFKKRTGPVSRLTVEEERSNICLISDGPQTSQLLDAKLVSDARRSGDKDPQ